MLIPAAVIGIICGRLVMKKLILFILLMIIDVIILIINIRYFPIVGLVLIPAAVIGIICGGLVMKKLKLNITGIVKFLLLMNFIPTIAMATLFIMTCSSIDLAGVTDPYGTV